MKDEERRRKGLTVYELYMSRYGSKKEYHLHYRHRWVVKMLLSVDIFTIHVQSMKGTSMYYRLIVRMLLSKHINIITTLLYCPKHVIWN